MGDRAAGPDRRDPAGARLHDRRRADAAARGGGGGTSAAGGLLRGAGGRLPGAAGSDAADPERGWVAACHAGGGVLHHDRLVGTGAWRRRRGGAGARAQGRDRCRSGVVLLLAARAGEFEAPVLVQQEAGNAAGSRQTARPAPRFSRPRLSRWYNSKTNYRDSDRLRHDFPGYGFPQCRLPLHSRVLVGDQACLGQRSTGPCLTGRHSPQAHGDYARGDPQGHSSSLPCLRQQPIGRVSYLALAVAGGRG